MPWGPGTKQILLLLDDIVARSIVFFRHESQAKSPDLLIFFTTKETGMGMVCRSPGPRLRHMAAAFERTTVRL